jgi:FkbM family methyltransferase
MNRRQLLGGVSGSFVLGTVGGAAAGAIGTATTLHDPLAKYFRTFSVSGEDILICSLWGRLAPGTRAPTYLDIGAYDPIAYSNTYLFYRCGGRGVLVEPNPARLERLRRVRPRDTVIMAGIGPSETGQADYYVFPNGPQANTFSKEEADALVTKFGEKLAAMQVIKMPILDINRVIAEHFGGKTPDLISIDAQGMDLPILRSLDFERFRPAIICAEIECDLPEAGREILALMQSRRYTVRAQSSQNAIFVDDHLTLAELTPWFVPD